MVIFPVVFHASFYIFPRPFSEGLNKTAYDFIEFEFYSFFESNSQPFMNPPQCHNLQTLIL